MWKNYPPESVKTLKLIFETQKKDLCQEPDRIIEEVKRAFAKDPFFINCHDIETLKLMLSILKASETSLLLRS